MQDYKLAIGVSGTGTTFEHIAAEIKAERLDLNLVFLFADRDCPAVGKARELGIRVLKRAEGEGISLFQKKVRYELEARGVDVVVLAGYLRLFPVANSDPFLVLNSHPAAIPDFGGAGFWGMRVHETVLEFAHATKFRHSYTYSTIHIAVGEYDVGPVVGLKRLEIKKIDTPESLAERLLPIEHQNYSEVLKRFSKNLVEYCNNPKDLVLDKERQVLNKIRKNILKRYTV